MTWPTKTDFVDGDVLTAAQVNNIGTNLNLFDPTSATNGQVPVADGAGSVAWGSAASAPWEQITVVTSNTTTVSTTASWADYRVIQAVGYFTTSSNQRPAFTINSDVTSTSYKYGLSYYGSSSGSFSHNNASGAFYLSEASYTGAKSFVIEFIKGQSATGSEYVQARWGGAFTDSFGTYQQAVDGAGVYTVALSTWSTIDITCAARSSTRLVFWGLKY